MKRITAEQVKKLKEQNHVVHAYPRKGQIVVDGFKYYRADKRAIAEAQSD